MKTNHRPQRSTRPLIAVACLIVLSAALTCCNTTRGVGRDVQVAGHTIEQTSDKLDPARH